MQTTFAEHIFRSYDIRGLLEEVTPEVARRAGMALVARTQAKKVVVGRDMRATSPELAQAAIEGIIAMGADVLDIGLCSTSMYNFAVTSRDDVDAGLMVTASHNPPQYNGIKMAHRDGLPIAGVEVKEWMDRELILGERQGRVAAFDVLPPYLDRCVELAGACDFSGVHVVIDYGNGMGSVSLRPLCERLGIRVTELFAEPDPRFPNHEPNPAIAKNLRDVTAAVVRERADFGVALDGDADRIAFIDDEGIPLRGDQTLALFARALFARHPGAKVVVSPNQSWIATDTIREHGGEAVVCPVGRTKVIAAMHASGAVLGGEVSSHFFFREFGNLEAVDYAFIHLLATWKASGMSMADFARDVRQFVNSWEVNVEVTDKIAAIGAIEARYLASATSVDRTDGVRCEFGRDAWFIARQSNTEPLIRLTVEAKDDATMRLYLDGLLACLRDSGTFMHLHD